MDTPNVVLVVLDSLRASQLSSYGYNRQTTPTIDKLANDGLRFTNSFANSSWTFPTHSTLFTGQYPSEHGSHSKNKRFDPDSDDLLPSRLSNAGYRTLGLSANPWISSEFGFDAGFDVFKSVKKETYVESTSHPEELYDRLDTDETVRKYARVLSWAMEGNPIKRLANLVAYRSTDKTADWANATTINQKVGQLLREEWSDEHPFFLFLNYMDTHNPYYPPDECFFDEPVDYDMLDLTWHLRSIDNPVLDEQRRNLTELYDASLRYLDREIGNLFATLEDLDELQNSIVVVTGDHGVCLGENDFVGAGTFLHDELVRVPLIISGPDVDKAEVDYVVDQIDIYATLLSAAGVDTARGRDLLDESERSDDRPVVAETMGPQPDVSVNKDISDDGYRRIETQDETLIRNVETGEIIRHESTPNDTAKQAEEEWLTDIRTSHDGQSTDESEEISDDMQEQLEKLGYL